MRYRVVLSTGRTLNAPDTITMAVGAKRWAKQWAEDIGNAGSIRLEEAHGDDWRHIGTARVLNSEVVDWEAP